MESVLVRKGHVVAPPLSLSLSVFTCSSSLLSALEVPGPSIKMMWTPNVVGSIQSICFTSKLLFYDRQRQKAKSFVSLPTTLPPLRYWVSPPGCPFSCGSKNWNWNWSCYPDSQNSNTIITMQVIKEKENLVITDPTCITNLR